MKNDSRKKMKSLEELSGKELASITTIGNDVGDRWTHYCAIDREGKVVAEGRFRTRSRDIQALYQTLATVVMILETGTHSPWMSRLIASFGHKVLVANSRDLHMIFKAKKKNDRVDAKTLAKVGQTDPELLHPIHHRSEQVQQDLAVLRARDILIKSRTGLINFARGIVKSLGERLPKCSADAFGTRMPAHVPETLRPVLTPVIAQIRDLTTEIHAYDKKITELLGTRYPDSQYLLAIRGVGPITTFAFMLLIEDPARFEKSRSVGAYFGLVPRLDDSGDKKSQLSITKAGDTLMRRLLVGAAQYMLGPFGEECDLRRHGESIAARGGKNAKKRAVVAVARKLAVLMHTLLRTRQTYDPNFNAKRCALTNAA